MALNPGTRLGPYEILSAIGAGGMGEVYKATDTNLKRPVAIKVLPTSVAADAERLARFEREAKVLAALNHPNIAAIYGLERSGVTTALVMELVEGEDLSQRIAHGTIAINEALPIAKQIADALEAAHEQGIIHRDLKPANIKIRADGTVKVLDFGLAKMTVLDGATSDLTQSPTRTVSGTREGIILGTAAYMSPEQARGKAVDKRTDIWAFGCVVYEMLTGCAAFGHETITDTLAAILEREPGWVAVPATTPAAVRRLLRHCLDKDPKRRLHDIADARIEIEEALSVPATPDSSHTFSGAARAHWRFAALVLSVVALGGIAGWSLRPVASPDGRAFIGIGRAEVRFQITTPPTTDPVSLAISPDGQKVVFVASSEGHSLLWLRSLDAVAARPLAGTDDAALPFWSPDSKAVAFFADQQLKRIDLDPGTVQALAAAEGGRGGAWNRDGTIVFQPDSGNTPLARVAATGGAPTALTGLKGRFPQFLPDGRHFIYYGFYGAAASETRGVYVAQLDGSEPRHLIDVDGAPVYASSGHLLFVRQGTLVAQAFDAATLKVTGDPFPVAGEMTVNGPLAVAPLSASAAGPLVYRTGSSSSLRHFAWFTRSGREIERVGDPASNFMSPTLSPDGRRLALHRVVNGNADIWLLETTRGVLSRFTSAAAAESNPVWSPDGSRLAFQSGSDVTLKWVDGNRPDERLVVTPGRGEPTDWSLDERFLLYTTDAEPNSSRDIWALPLVGDRKPFPVVQTKFDERDGQFSPDGKWIAYTSNESGRPEVYVQQFPGPVGKSQISTNGGGMARWRRDGKELFYIALDGLLMAVPVRPSIEGALVWGTPVSLFATRVGGPVQANSKQQYVVSADGQRFLLNMLAEENASPITVILNWKAKP